MEPTRFGFDAAGRFDGTKKYFWAYHGELMTTLEKNGVRWIVEDNVPSPMKPMAAFAFGAEGPTDDQHRRIEKYHESIHKHQKEAEKCIGIIKDSITATPKSTFSAILGDVDINTRERCKQLVTAMCAHYGKADEASKIALQDDMDRLPDATDMASAMGLLTGMNHINDILKRFNAGFSDSTMKTKMFRKLKGQRFDQVAHQINSTPYCTFAEASIMLEDALQLQNTRDPDQYSDKKRSVDSMQSSSNMYATAATSSSSSTRPYDEYLASVFPPSSSIQKRPRFNQYEPESTVSAIMQSQSAQSNAEQVPYAHINGADTQQIPSVITCWNCSNTGHNASNCNALMCRRCNSMWKSYQDPNYHRLPDCPHQTASARTSQFSHNNGGRGGGGRGRGGRGNQTGRGNYGRGSYQNSGGRGTGGQPRPTPTYNRVNTITTETGDQDWDEYTSSHIQQDPSQHEDYDEYDDRDVRVFDGSQSSSNTSIANARRCLQDSGANVNACPRELVIAYELPVYEYNKPFRVVFGNGTVVTATHYTYVGILGVTAIVDGCINTIISVPCMNKRGYDVSFLASMRCVVAREQHVILDTPIDTDKTLYFVDVESLMSISDPSLVIPQVNTLQQRTHRVSQSNAFKVHTLHNALRHAASPAVMARALRLGAWTGVDIMPTTVEQVFRHQNCLSCMLGKANRLPRNDGTGLHPNVFGTCASVDFKPVSPPSLAGHIGFYLFTESTTSLKFSVMTKNHDSECLLQAIKDYTNYLQKYNHTLEKLRFDAGTVENSQDLDAELATMKIHTDPAPPECQFQNPVERNIQTVLKGVAAMFAGQQLLRRYYWNIAVLSYLQADTACPNSNSGDYSPEFYLTGHHPDISSRFKFYFGQPVVCMILKAQKSNFTFAPRGELAIAVASGPGFNSTATLVLIPSKSIHRLYLRHDVRPIKALKADSSSTRSREEIEAMQPTMQSDGTIAIPAFKVNDLSSFDICVHPSMMPLQGMLPDEEDVSILISDVSTSDSDTWPLSSGGVVTEKKVSPQVSTNIPLEAAATDFFSPVVEPISHRLRKPNSEAHISFLSSDHNMIPTSVSEDIWINDYEWNKTTDDSTINASTESYIHAVKKLKTEEQAMHDGEDVSTAFAQASPEWKTIWEPAAKDEFTTLLDNNTGKEIAFEDIPTDAPILPSKMLFKKKQTTTGTFDRAKARLVVCGNWIQVMFLSLFAPTVNEKSMKIMFALAMIFGLTLTGIDVKGAFLYPELKRPVYISLPKRLTGLPHVYWKLHKTLYGLPESPQAFYEDVSKLLLKNGYTRTNADPCMFYMRKNGHFIMFTVHVDDFACASSSPYMTNHLLAVLRTRYTITTEESLEAYLGINIQYRSDGSMILTQPRRIDELVAHYGPEFTHMRAPSIPMSTTFDDDFQNDSPRCDYTEYMSLLGKLIHVIKTRPDIAYAVNRLATRAQLATDKDYIALLRIVAYLKATHHLGIRLWPGKWNESTAPKLYGYLDAAYACHADSKSHTGYSFCLDDPCNAMFYSRTMKQTNVTLSSTEAENSAAVEATKEALWFRQLLMDLGFVQLEPTVMFSDSASMITLASSYSGNHKRVKHYITRVNFMIEQVQKGHIQLKHVSGTMNVSDMLTKPLGPQDFIRLRAHLLGME